MPQQATARALLNEAWARLLSRALPTSGDPRIASALTELDRRYADPAFRLHALARQLAVSGSRLTQMLKQATGRTFGAHLHARRVAEARLLLANGTLSVKEVAVCVGYSATSQLDRHFKKIVGRLPSQCRAAVVRPVVANRTFVPRAR
jgi:AraC-like DNA-binding protein